ncbi:transmembrane protein 106A isoform X1 [Alligator mississippiensis]|uniref:Transmembrane protein 106A n=1 Tax=Alligator mississippiensis TaxID=8496 RepID=A0A151PC24_ALLMI|nr:transmembrane protein 106A isoform X1 [Alligator mississippiensis]XP_019355932.1 transmembrane protein 106A isoform X1 [Alligator mississippiensis]XP_019355935.1 transmembrane protein 106A isoform X1 [Alligator mississippiensis]XP_019355938.1 transmembrane protein 106A isoform X1 [Alligator mississippiensis]XP_019355942.1 transmembrane protein 106A isoform X1 [Alligator mississippiensis]KYO46474.1 transmembrane protein 106A [Alligator mississippiensis]
MGESLSNLWKGSGQKESEPVLPKKSIAEDEVSGYGSINATSCAPCLGIASRGCVNCPTCQGTGRIPREQEKQLVALIPYGDQRLKPRRTKLYVSLAVVICLLMSCLIIFFLFPRSINVQPAGLNASSIAFDAAISSIILNMTNLLNITNSNFYPIAVSKLEIEVLHLTLVIGKTSMKHLLNMGPLQSGQIYYMVSNMITDNNTYNICTWTRIKVHNILLHIQGTLTCSYLCHSEQLAFENYQYVDCRGNTTSPHPLYHGPP